MLVGWYFSEMESNVVNRYILQKCFYQTKLSGDVELHLYIHIYIYIYTLY